MEGLTTTGRIVPAMERRIRAVMGNSQRLDGGAMFGNAPRARWSRWLPPDDDNRIPLACRAMLVSEPSRTVLLEAGVGAFFPPELRERYGIVEARHVLLDSLAALGLSDADVDVVVLSHLHFDHAGGLLSAWRPDAPPRLLFPNATFVVSTDALARSRAPHVRDRASFVPELPDRLEGSGRLHVTDGPRSEVLGDGYRLHLSHGHTPGLLLTEVDAPGGPILFASDLVPGRPWVHLPITMGYDRAPEVLVDEKRALLEDLHARGGRLFFTHDHEVALASLERDDRGRLRAVPAALEA